MGGVFDSDFCVGGVLPVRGGLHRFGNTYLSG